MFKIFRLCGATFLLSTTALFAVSPASAGDRLELAASANGRAPSLTVISVSERQDGLREPSLRLNLSLRAQPSDLGSGYKILNSEIYLKQEGPVSGDGAKTSLENDQPVVAFSLDKDFVFAIDPHGAVVQNALAVCGGLSKNSRTGSMTLPVVWRVRSGRFNFRWLQANVDSPSDDMLQNPDFYADREIQEFEWPVTVEITCETAGPAVAKAAPAKPETVAAKEQVSSPEAAPRSPEASKVAAAKPATSENSAVETASGEGDGQGAEVKAAGDVGAQTLVCDGGMVRKLSGGARQSICICPGNTRRHETGPNEFACERRVGRR